MLAVLGLEEHGATHEARQLERLEQGGTHHRALELGMRRPHAGEFEGERRVGHGQRSRFWTPAAERDPNGAPSGS
jgi:hypothetical protein